MILRAVFALNEAMALLDVEPLHASISHRYFQATKRAATREARDGSNFSSGSESRLDARRRASRAVTSRQVKEQDAADLLQDRTAKAAPTAIAMTFRLASRPGAV